MNDAAPLFEVEMKTAIEVQGNNGLDVINDEAINRIYDLKISGKSILANLAKKRKKKGLKHEVPMEAATLSLIHELLRDHNTDLKFTSNYFYIHRLKKKKKESSVNYMAIGPITAQVEGNAKHILPGRFMRVKDESPINYFIKFDKRNGLSLGKNMKITKYTRSRINSELRKVDNKNKLLHLYKSGHVSVSNELVKLEKMDNGTLHFVFRMEAKFYRYYWGEFIRVLPMPEFPGPGSFPRHGLLLGIGDCWWADPPSKAVSSPWKQTNLWGKIEELNPILLAGGKQTVLIVGEPGSGKEVFSSALHHGAVRKRAGDAGLKTRAIANMSNNDLAELLYGRMVDGTKISGLIGEAEGGTLFLDEFDKVEKPSWYAELLRVLEAGEYVPVKGSKVEKVNDVNWILAGAFTGNGSSKRLSSLPPDFWSRLTAQVRIVNPIRLAPQIYEDKQISYAGAIFAYIVLQEASKLAGGVSSLLDSEVFPSDYAKKLIIDTDNSGRISKKFMTDVCLEFQSKISSGVYCRFNQVNPKPILALYWTDLASGENFSLPNVSRNYQLEYAFDSVRSIIKAGQAAFIIMRDEAMVNKYFWHKEDVLSSIYKKAVAQSTKIVRNARPGKQVGKKDGKWVILEGD